MLCAYRLATVQLTRLSRLRRSAYPLASACCALTVVRQHRRKKYPWGAVRLKSLHFRNNPTSRFAKRWLFFECQLFICSSCSWQESGGSSACGNEIAAKRRCLAFPAEPCKADTAGTPPDEPKSRKMHQCEHVESTHVSPPNPRIKKPDSKGRLWSPLACLSSISFFTQRKISPPEAPAAGCRIRAAKNVKTKGMCPRRALEKQRGQ